jgi:hypothetical protein
MNWEVGGGGGLGTFGGQGAREFAKVGTFMSKI